MSEFDAFISYSHKDAEVAGRLVQRMRSYRPPRSIETTRKKLRVFRDVDSLTTDTDLDKVLAERIRESKKFILLSSEVSAKSEQVKKEVDEFLAHRDFSEIIVCIVGGDELTLPSSLNGRIEKPLYADLRKIPGLIANLRQFKTESLRVIASVHGVDFDKLCLKEERRKKIRGVAWGVSLIVVALFAIATWKISETPSEQWAEIQIPQENGDSSQLVLKSVAIRREQPDEISFWCADGRYYQEVEVESERIRLRDGDDAADEYVDSYVETSDAAWADHHTLHANSQRDGFVDKGEEYWDEHIEDSQEWNSFTGARPGFLYVAVG